MKGKPTSIVTISKISKLCQTDRFNNKGRTYNKKICETFQSHGLRVHQKIPKKYIETNFTNMDNQ